MGHAATAATTNRPFLAASARLASPAIDHGPDFVRGVPLLTEPPLGAALSDCFFRISARMSF